MDDRRRTLAAITVLVGFLVLIAIIVGVIVNSNKVISPVPEDDAIKIIFVSPTIVPVISASPSATTKSATEQ
jgi:hypothetical protein